MPLSRCYYPLLFISIWYPQKDTIAGVMLSRCISQTSFPVTVGNLPDVLNVPPGGIANSEGIAIKFISEQVILNSNFILV